MKEVVIIGAGISGLATGWKLAEEGAKVTVLEQNDYIGGMCASFKHDGFILDYGPHKIYSQLPGMMGKIRNDVIGADQTLTIKKKNSIRLLGRYFSFPINPVQMLKSLSLSTVIAGTKAGAGYINAVAKGTISRRKPRTYEEYFLKGFGRTGYDLVFRDYAWKVWGDPSKLSEEIARKRTPIPSVFQLVKNTFSGKKNKPDVSAEFFYYPKKNIGVVCNNLRRRIEEKNGKILFNAKPTKINLEGGRAVSVDIGNKTIKADFIVSTTYIRGLADLLGLGNKQAEDITNLKYRSLIVIYIFLNKKKALEDNWIFFPERKFIFNRVSEQKSFSRYSCPKNKTVIMAEITCNYGGQLWNMNDEDLFKAVIRDLEDADITTEEEVEQYISKRMKDVYPIYNLQYKKSLNRIQNSLDAIPNLVSIGRHGLFNYNNIDHCIDMAEKTADYIIHYRKDISWKQLRKRFNDYRIVD
ncbi:FAD-dependent oxidoreductase [Candidatus Woesearchaeota archaeon]|nr:FAD-dependent oxidoreductase [Candidatus Woesearchaeota archaeon]